MRTLRVPRNMNKSVVRSRLEALSLCGWAHVRRRRRTRMGIRDIVRVRIWSHCDDNNPSTWTHSCREKFWKTLRLYNSLLSHANSENDFGWLIFANRHRVDYIIVVCTCKPVYTVVVVLCAKEPSRVIYN